MAELSEKRMEELETVDKTLATPVQTLRAHTSGLCRGEAIASTTVAMGVEEEDRLATWLVAQRPGQRDYARCALIRATGAIPRLPVSA